MWTNENTPLIISIGIAAGCLAIGLVIGSSLSIVISGVISTIVVCLGMISRRMTHMWLTDDVRLWAGEIRRFERQDQRDMPPPNQIVFFGSSTIRYWQSLADDMAPLPIVRRGFGGSRILDAVYYADRMVIAYRPAAVVVFSGTNDIAGKVVKPAAYVAEKFQEFCAVIHAALPDVPIYYLSITPTPGRWEHWPTVQEANRLIATYTTTDERLHFIDIAALFLDKDGQPRRELYRRDRIHLSAEGYAILAEAVKKVLMHDWADIGAK